MSIRVLHVIRSLSPESGGTAEGLKQLAAATARLNHTVEIATFDPADSPWLREYDCPIHALGPAYLIYGYAPRYAAWLRANIGRFDAVVVNGIWQYHSYATWQVLHHRPAVPYYVYTHGMLDPWFKHRYPLKHLKKLMYWPWAEYRVLRDARAVLFTSEEERLLARNSFSLYRANEVVVGYGVDVPRGDSGAQRELFRSQYPHLRGRRLLLYLGRIHPKKGCDLLIEAFAAAARTDPLLHLVIAGPASMEIKASLVRLAERLGIDSSITWTGMLRGDVKAGAFHAAEAFILPSHQENFGIAVVEALACGLPVLISNKVNIWREVSGDNAGLVADDTLQGTESLLLKWLALDGAAREQMRRSALHCFERRFHIDTAARNLLTVLEQRGIAIGPRLAA